MDGLTLAKFNLIKAEVSKGFPDTGSLDLISIQQHVVQNCRRDEESLTGFELPDIGYDV